MAERYFTRVDFCAIATIKFGNSEIECDADNLSLHGMHLKTGSDIPVNIPVRVTINRPGDVSFNANARVVWKEMNGVGLQINGLTPESFSELRKIVIDNCSDRSRVAKESLSMLKVVYPIYSPKAGS